MSRRSPNINTLLMLRRTVAHPMLAVGSEIKVLRGKMTNKTFDSDHESVFDMRMQSCDRWRISHVDILATKTAERRVEDPMRG